MTYQIYSYNFNIISLKFSLLKKKERNSKKMPSRNALARGENVGGKGINLITNEM